MPASLKAGLAQTRGETVESGEKSVFERKPSKNTALILVVISVLGLFIRLVHFWAISRTAFPRIPLVFTQSDMHTFLEWAQTIISGDILGRDTYHPYFMWMKEIASLESWYRWWGGKEIFQQAPLYPYWVAGLLALSGQSLNFVLFMQLVAGAFQPLVMFFLGQRLFDRPTGLLAAVITALYGPFIFHQGALLKDWLPSIIGPLVLVLLLRARAEARSRDWFFAGILLGVGLLIKESVLSFLPFVGAWLLWEMRSELLGAVKPAALLLAGFFLAMSPLMVRNAVVGAPVFALSNRGATDFIVGNAADALPIGLHHPASMKGILERSQGRKVAVIAETLRTYQGNWSLFVNHYLIKLRGLVDPLEMPNNLSFYYGLDISPVLGFTLGWGTVFPLGMAGFIVFLKTWRRHLLVIFDGVSHGMVLMAVIVAARYRLSLVPVLILYGAAGLAQFVTSIQHKQLTYAIVFISLISGFSLLQQFAPFRNIRAVAALNNGVEYFESAELYAADGQFDRSLSEVERLEAKATAERDRNLAPLIDEASLRQGNYYSLWADHLLKEGKRDEARNLVEKAEAAFSNRLDLPTVNYNLGLLYLKLRNGDNARAYLNRFLSLEAAGARAAAVRSLLSRLDASR